MKQQIKEVPASKVSGFVALIVVLAIALIGGWQAWSAIQRLQEVSGSEIFFLVPKI